MKTVFRSCLPRSYSNSHQSISSANLSHTSLANKEHDRHSPECLSNTTSQNVEASKTKCSTISFDSTSKTTSTSSASKQLDFLSLPETINKICNKNRGPCYLRVDEQPKPLLKRLVGRIFGDNENNNCNETTTTQYPRSKKLIRNSKKSILPSKSIVKKQFDKNEKTLRSLVTFLTQMESNTQLETTKTSSEDITVNHECLSVEKEQLQNKHRTDDVSSNETFRIRSKAKNRVNTRSTKRHVRHKKQACNDKMLCSSSITSHNSMSSLSDTRRRMIDHQQQTQIYSSKINIGTSTQSHDTNDMITAEPSWLDVINEDQATINAWARIRRRLKPNQQKDILKALMIICANLFEVPIETKHF